MVTVMRPEKRYQAAIVALRDRKWEQAALHLLALTADAPDYRNVSDVLVELEKTRPVAYWRAAFNFALERKTWKHAETAIEMLNQLDTAMPDLPDMVARLEQAREAGNHHVAPPLAANAPPTAEMQEAPPPETDTPAAQTPSIETEAETETMDAEMPPEPLTISQILEAAPESALNPAFPEDVDTTPSDSGDSDTADESPSPAGGDLEDTTPAANDGTMPLEQPEEVTFDTNPLELPEVPPPPIEPDSIVAMPEDIADDDLPPFIRNTPSPETKTD